MHSPRACRSVDAHMSATHQVSVAARWDIASRCTAVSCGGNASVILADATYCMSKVPKSTSCVMSVEASRGRGNKRGMELSKIGE